MKISLRQEAIFVIHVLVQAGYEVFLVGGAVRDLLLFPDKVTDYDFATNATPEQVQLLFPESFYENEYGTVMITPSDVRLQMDVDLPAMMTQLDRNQLSSRPERLIDLKNASKIHVSLQTQPELTEPSEFNPLLESSQPDSKNQQVVERNLEITTFRSESSYSDHRRPESVTWGQTLDQDLSRRDFTINAMAIKIDLDWDESTPLFGSTLPAKVELSSSQWQLIDLWAGRVDLENNLIRTVGDPNQRFAEDALRMLRAIRFAVQLGFEIVPETMAAITQHSNLIQHVSLERIRDEFIKMITSPHPKMAIELLDATGLLTHIIPELLEAKGVRQAGHHTTDVWTHSLDALENCPSPDPIVRLATLLHDISKPSCYQEINGQPTFYNHEIVGSRVAKKIAARLRLSKHDQDRVFSLVRYHMFHYQPENTDASIRRFMKKVGLVNIDDILDLREGDRLGSGARKTSWRLEEMKQRMIEQLNQPMDVTDLAINGHDLIDHLQLKPGRLIGEILQRLLEMVLDQPELNNRQSLLAKSAEIAKSIQIESQ